ncbi:MAG: DUF4143 domain-containing protein [Desulfobacterales bacterium]|nr:DUF4143 domain-containing protein [Desulfobacterales bacterium]
MPSFFMEKDLPERDFQEWMDAFWAKDIQELFRLERRHSFQKFIELLMAQSGGMFEATRFAKPCEVSRTTISNYLAVLEATYVISIIRPFSTHRPTEIVSAPKRNQAPVAIECKWSASDFDPAGIKAFRKQYPEGENFVVANAVDRQYAKSFADIKVAFVNLAGLFKSSQTSLRAKRDNPL